MSTAVPGASLPDSARIPPSRIFAWGLCDWGSSAFNAVATTFVFTVYLTSSSFGPAGQAETALGWALSGAGAVIAVTAPITGQRSDAAGHRRRSLAMWSALVFLALVGMAFIRPDPSLLWLGIALVAVGNVFFEFAGVSYNAMLAQVSTPRTVGRVSGFGWGMGYVGGIALLLIVYFGFIQGGFGLPTEGGTAVQLSMALAAVWFGVFAVPVLVAVPRNPLLTATPTRRGVLASYRSLRADIVRLWRDSRQTVWFLLASAIFRDGLAGVFTFGGIIAATVFGFTAGQVIVFAIVGNIVAGVATIAVGMLDDRLGAKPVIVASLVGLIAAGLGVFLFRDGGTTVFWIGGLVLCAFVGPAQSASRTFLARLIPSGREGEVFGLYATTGRAASFLAPAMFALFVSLFGATAFGILGIVLVLAVGLALLLPVRAAR